MKILAPLRAYDQIDIYCAAGATEFYFGFADPEWSSKFGNTADLNRMSAMKEKSNSFKKSDVPKVVEALHERNCKNYLVLNGNMYSSEHISYFKDLLSGFTKDNKPDGIIFSDIQLISPILEAGISPVASTMCAIYNSDILEFYVKEGVERIIFPRELSLDEMKVFLEKYPKIQFEAFLMRDGCMFSDSNCLGVHRENHGGVCSFIRNSNYEITGEENLIEKKKMNYRHFLYCDAMLRSACGLCAIYRMVKMGVYSGKIVGRADRTEEVKKDILAVKRNIEIAEKCQSEEEYLKNMYIPDRWKMICGLSCYYPEIEGHSFR